jgi:hypothetical protein
VAFSAKANFLKLFGGTNNEISHFLEHLRKEKCFDKEE